MVKEYSITTYPDAKKVQAELDQLAKAPLVPLKHEAMQAYLQYFEQKCKKSKQITTEAKETLPGGVQHNLAFNHPFPIAIAKADGAYMYDVDGNQYIDFLCAGGPTLIGNNWKPVRDKVVELLNECGPVTGLFHEYELKLANLIKQYYPSCEMFRMLGSGTEADMAAIRLARTVTGKSKVIKAGGAYHGWSDQLVFGLHIPGSSSAEAIGIPRDCNKNTQEFYPNDIDGLKKQMEQNDPKGGTACVLLEPLGPESGTRPSTFDFNKQVRELCDKFGALLIFDEVVTGFRVGLKGAQGYFGIKPDITVFGKCIAGGYPMAGAIGGRKDIISYCAAGVESGKKRAYVGGTLSANPLSCVAGYWYIKEIERTDAAVKAGKAGDRLTKGLQETITKYHLPYVVYSQGSIVHLETSGAMFVDLNDPKAMESAKARKVMMEEMGAAYMAEGIITLAGSRIYTMMAHTDKIIDDAIQRFDRIFSMSEAAKK
nr:aminotransferase class III-fold pyridoxal phosphate-dependent enzyme [Candidatus Sigynarchaeota archaeon]